MLGIDSETYLHDPVSRWFSFAMRELFFIMPLAEFFDLFYGYIKRLGERRRQVLRNENTSPKGREDFRAATAQAATNFHPSIDD